MQAGDQPARSAARDTMINQWLDASDGWQDASLDHSHRSQLC
jgi:hypothetical protein